MKLLIYGGCHAQVLKQLILDLAPPDRHQIDVLINFELIQSGRPFPYEELSGYDAVVYSPVENKGSYNTIHLDEACRHARVTAVRYPWLEWHGYAPTSDKEVFWGNVSWYFPGLVDLSVEFGDFETFHRAAVADYPASHDIDRYFHHSTRKLKEQESRAGCEITISDFILSRYRDDRMFLIPDHPTLVIYRYVLERLEALLETTLIESWPRDVPEPQPEAQTPILPKIAASLGLRFRDETWRCTTQPLHAMSLKSYLALHFALGRARREAEEDPSRTVTLATARRPTCISASPSDAREAVAVQVPIFTQMLLRQTSEIDGRDHFRAEIMSTLASPTDGAPLEGHRRFRTEDWICRT